VPLDIKLNLPNPSEGGAHDTPPGTPPLRGGREGFLLIISGPNAGGKSVCLKTVGLLQYMLQCGLSIPIGERSTVGVFQNIMIDIGDEQSIADDLSTYSSHLLNMKNMMKQANARTLLLIDEFGGGTEPTIGGAIAEAVLKQFWKKEAFGVITTHYQNLKHFAEDHPGVVNGAMLYDRHQMQALFQLSIGQPGSSFAIEIARKTGIPEEVISDASEIVGSDYIQSDKYLQDIVRDKRYWEQKRQNIRQKEKQLDEIIAHYENERTELSANRKAILREAKEQASQLLDSSNAQIENTIRSIREAQAGKEQTRQAREELATFRSELDKQLQGEEEALKARHPKRKKNGVRIKRPVVSEPDAPSAHAYAVGDYVRLDGQAPIGQILELKGKNAIVAFGNLRTNVKTDRLEPASAKEAKSQKAESRTYTYISRETQEAIVEKKLNFHQDIDVRGMRGMEAVQAVTYFIDDAILLGVHRVRILHGTGGGILRNLIREQLRTNPAVLSAHDEHVQFGGAGITVVDLA